MASVGRLPSLVPSPSHPSFYLAAMEKKKIPPCFFSMAVR